MPRLAQTKTPPKPTSDILANATNNAIRVGGLAVDVERSGAGMAAGGESGGMARNLEGVPRRANQYSGDFHPESGLVLPKGEVFGSVFLNFCALYWGCRFAGYG